MQGCDDGDVWGDEEDGEENLQREADSRQQAFHNVRTSARRIGDYFSSACVLGPS